MSLESCQKITLILTGDGFIVDSEESTMVFYNEVEDVQQLLSCLLDMIGHGGSRHDEKRLCVRIEQGDKYEPENQ